MLKKSLYNYNLKLQKIALLLFFIFCTLVRSGNAQPIKKYSIKEVVNYFSKQNDTLYVVNFWSTYCKPCLDEIPFLQKISKQFASQKVKLILVSLDAKSFYQSGKLQAFVKKRGITATTFWLSDTNADIFCPAIDSSWSGAIPATIIINKQRNYKKFYEEEFTPTTFKEAIQNGLKRDK